MTNKKCGLTRRTYQHKTCIRSGHFGPLRILAVFAAVITVGAMNRTKGKIWIIAGEASGDAYGAALALEMKEIVPELSLCGMGGDAMAAAGVDLFVDSSELGVVGLVEVFKHLPKFHAIFHDLVERASQERPDAVVLIDYPGFNLRFARKVHELNIPVVYYVSPQVWAWGRRRIPQIAAVVDKMLVIFPFEQQVYARTDLDVEFVGHPLLEILERCKTDVVRDNNLILLLPGSRSSEIERLLPVMLKTAQQLQNERQELSFVVAAPRRKIAEHIQQKIRKYEAKHGKVKGLEIVTGQTREWLQKATVGLAASGTVTMEAAILGLPLVVIYRVQAVTYWLSKLIVNVPYFTMVNLVAGKMVYEEFLQNEVKPENLLRALKDILPDGGRRAEVEAGIKTTIDALGGQTDVGKRAARAVLKTAAIIDGTDRQ